MRLIFLCQGGDEKQSTNHRMIAVAKELKSRGHNIDIVCGHNYDFVGRPFVSLPAKGPIYTILNKKNYDGVIANRGGGPIAVLSLIAAKIQGIPFIFDIDDDLYSERTITSTSLPNPFRVFLPTLLENSDLVIASNTLIKSDVSKYADKVEIIPTPVDTSVFYPRENHSSKSEIFTIGWMGDGNVHSENLDLLINPLRRLGQDIPIRFRIISALNNDSIYNSFSPLENLIKVDYGFRSWQPIHNIAREMQSFDVGVMPLKPTVFNKRKSSIKVAEYWASKIPVIASDTGPYKRAITDNVDGLLAGNEDEWVEHINYFYNNTKERDQLANAGYKKAINTYSLNSFATKLVNYIKRLDKVDT